MKDYELVIFDCDGTLVDSEKITNKVIAQLLNEMGIEVTAEETFEHFAGKKFKDIEAFIFKALGKWPTKEFENDFRTRTNLAFETELEQIEGVESLIKNLNSKICIASNGPKIKMDITLKVTKLDQYFPSDTIFSAYDINIWKPQPDLFLIAAEKMNVAPEKCIVIEDSLSGALGGINAQMKVLAYNPHKRRDLLDLDIPSFETMDAINTYLTNI